MRRGPDPIIRAGMLPSFDEIVANFEFLDDWDERYRYVIELGRMMEPLPDAARTEANKVRGCAPNLRRTDPFSACAARVTPTSCAG